MSFFRSPLLRRIIYLLAFALAVLRFASTRSHSETFDITTPDVRLENTAAPER